MVINDITINDDNNNNNNKKCKYVNYTFLRCGRVDVGGLHQLAELGVEADAEVEHPITIISKY